MSAVAPPADDRATLVSLLQTAAQIEHCLMLSYLVAGCSLRSTPQEFETLENGKPNQRRAVQFELVRGWKQKTIVTAVEEMLHLHYVQCLLRAIGERPHLGLPDRNAKGDWVIPGWEILDPRKPDQPAVGTSIGLAPIDPDRLQQFVAYESTDSLQDADIHSPEIQELFQGLYQKELDLRFETILLNADEAQREEFKPKLKALYAPAPLIIVEPTSPVLPIHRFQSIADLYRKGIEPLYQRAFDLGWVKYSNLMLNDELFNPNYAGGTGGRMVPTGPIQRSSRFATLIAKSADNPLRNFKSVEDIVEVILGEGEGVLDFQKHAKELLEMWRNEGTRPYAKGLGAAILTDGWATPKWMAKSEIVRQSHLYRFAMIRQALLEERGSSFSGPASGAVDFDPNRKRLDMNSLPDLQRTATELPAQVNACYLVLIAWMARVYEVENWTVDKPRRAAIEMLAAWPLMSLAMRPLLELLSFFPYDSSQLFQMEIAAASSPEAQRVAELFRQTSRTEQENAHMDESAVAVLAEIAGWSRKQIDAVRGASIPGYAKQMILTRLQMLSQLDEFQKQFPYRVAGGYSNRMPSVEYQQQYPDSARFEEDPFEHKPPSQKAQAAPPLEFPVFSETLVLRLRFSGWTLAQLANDPDPANDEMGCSGGTMLHPADYRWFDRAIVWQPTDLDHIILREPRDKLPEIGVTCKEISLLVADGAAQVGYVPIPTQQLPGALQNAPVLQELGVEGLLHLRTLATGEILGEGRKMRVDLKAKNGVKPFFNGLNHLVWQDGEPIDPFVLTMTADAPPRLPPPEPLAPGAPAPAPVPQQVQPDPPSLVLQREVYNRNLSLLEMTPLQRLLSSRGPCGYGKMAGNIPEWAFPAADVKALGNANAYLAQRAGVLLDALRARLDSGGDSQQDTDEAVSFAERLALVTTPIGTSLAWMRIILHYGHTLSGDLAVGDGLNEVISAFAAQTGLQLGVSYTGARYVPNSRWLVKYGCGVMDVDALSNLVYGELFIPVTITQVAGPIHLADHWTLPAGMLDTVSAFACQFSKPFWADYQVDGNTRTLASPDLTIVETLQPPVSESAYSYTISGLADVSSCQCQFEAAVADAGTTLTWSVALSCTHRVSLVKAVAWVASAAQDMKAALTKYFVPKD